MSQVIIIGADLAGLACAKALTAQGIDALVLEAADAPGGRLRTEEIEGSGSTGAFRYCRQPIPRRAPCWITPRWIYGLSGPAP